MNLYTVCPDRAVADSLLYRMPKILWFLYQPDYPTIPDPDYWPMGIYSLNSRYTNPPCYTGQLLTK